MLAATSFRNSPNASGMKFLQDFGKSLPLYAPFSHHQQNQNQNKISQNNLESPDIKTIHLRHVSDSRIVY